MTRAFVIQRGEVPSTLCVGVRRAVKTIGPQAGYRSGQTLLRVFASFLSFPQPLTKSKPWRCSASFSFLSLSGRRLYWRAQAVQILGTIGRAGSAHKPKTAHVRRLSTRSIKLRFVPFHATCVPVAPERAYLVLRLKPVPCFLLSHELAYPISCRLRRRHRQHRRLRASQIGSLNR